MSEQWYREATLRDNRYRMMRVVPVEPDYPRFRAFLMEALLVAQGQEATGSVSVDSWMSIVDAGEKAMRAALKGDSE